MGAAAVESFGCGWVGVYAAPCVVVVIAGGGEGVKLEVKGEGNEMENTHYLGLSGAGAS